MLRVAVLIDLPPGQAYHVATLEAIEHASRALGVAVESRVLRTNTIPGDLDDYAAIIVGPGSPYDDPEAVHAAIRTARERGIPLVGT
jgi:CTP synthase (UTP-ammonia lyase)